MKRGTALVALLAAALIALAGCGGSTADAPPAHPFGDPPPAVPGVHAWAAGEVGTLLVTADGGHSWERQRFYLSQRSLDVAFPDATTGWIITDAGAVLRTTNGGAAWDVVKVAELQLKAVAAVDATTAWVAGMAGSTSDPGKGVLLRTTDGGQTWKRAAGAFGDSVLADVAFADERRGVLVALDRVWVTRDGGRSWRLSRRQAMSVLTSACAGGDGTLWIAGWGTADGAPFVLVSTSGGRKWRKLEIGAPAPGDAPLQAGQIVCVGPGVWLTCSAGVLASQDAGETWELQESPAGQPVAIAAADGRHLLAATSTQPVLATSDGGATWRAWGSDGFLKQPLVAIAAVSVPVGE